MPAQRKHLEVTWRETRGQRVRAREAGVCGQDSVAQLEPKSHLKSVGLFLSQSIELRAWRAGLEVYRTMHGAPLPRR